VSGSILSTRKLLTNAGRITRIHGLALPPNGFISNPMSEKHPKRPRDLNQWAKRTVDLATVDETERSELAKKTEKAEVRE
jgi:hypothetical protein